MLAYLPTIQPSVGVRRTWCTELQLISHRLVAKGKGNAEEPAHLDEPEKKNARGQDQSPAVPVTLQVAVCTVQTARMSCTGRCNGLLPIPDGDGVRHRDLLNVRNWRA